MVAESALVEHLTDVLRPLGGVAARRMFGGAGLFRDGVMFALISDEVLYLKADATTIPAFEAEDLGPFTYGTKNGKRVLTSYWRAPERLLDDDEEMRAWCRRASELAHQIGATEARQKADQSYPGGGTKPPISRSTRRLNAIAVLS